MCTMHCLVDNGQASMGCAFSRAAQGRKLSFEAAQALANFGFANLSLHRIYAETISNPSVSVAWHEKRSAF